MEAINIISGIENLSQNQAAKERLSDIVCKLYEKRQQDLWMLSQCTTFERGYIIGDEHQEVYIMVLRKKTKINSTIHFIPDALAVPLDGYNYNYIAYNQDRSNIIIYITVLL